MVLQPCNENHRPQVATILCGAHLAQEDLDLGPKRRAVLRQLAGRGKNPLGGLAGLLCRLVDAGNVAGYLVRAACLPQEGNAMKQRAGR
jgi:hypothetical protein